MGPYAELPHRNLNRKPAGRRSGLHRLAVAAIGLGAWLGSAVHAIDFGDASVLSQQGQRLRVAVPYGSAPGETLSVLRFSVLAADAGPGEQAPAPSAFEIAKPAQRNVVFFVSPKPFNAATLRLTIGLADAAGTRVTYDLRIPPFRASPPATSSEMRAPAPVRMDKSSRGKRSVKKDRKTR